jgi:hypothetical protein
MQIVKTIYKYSQKRIDMFIELIEFLKGYKYFTFYGVFRLFLLTNYGKTSIIQSSGKYCIE